MGDFLKKKDILPKEILPGHLILDSHINLYFGFQGSGLLHRFQICQNSPLSELIPLQKSVSTSPNSQRQKVSSPDSTCEAKAPSTVDYNPCMFGGHVTQEYTVLV